MARASVQGHAMRRRTGAPSNYLETAGKSMSRSIPTSDEHYAAHAAAGSAKIPMGANDYNVEPVMPVVGTLMPKKNVQAGDPTNPGSKGNRANLPYQQERLGAAYTPKANFLMTVDPAAGATMRSAKIVPSVAGRQTPNFGMGIQSSQQ